jgi:O-antigen ligase
LNLLDKYRELLYVSLFLLLFRDNNSRYWGLYAFIISMIITLLLSYLIAFGGWEIGKGTVDNPTPFKNYITQGLLMSLVGYFIIVQGLQATRNRWLIAIAILLIFYNIFFMMAGRTGYLIVICLILLGGYQSYRWRGLLIGLVCTGMLGILIYMNSEVLQHRIANTFSDLDRYEQGITEGSTAMRYEFVKNSLILITQHPWIGSGTGSFDQEYQALIADQNMRLTTNPHSEYLMIAVQWGLIGLSLFLYLLYRLWQLSDLLPNANRWMAQGLVITMVAGCLVNSLWLDTTEGHLFAYLIGLFYSPLLCVSKPA